MFSVRARVCVCATIKRLRCRRKNCCDVRLTDWGLLFYYYDFKSTALNYYLFGGIFVSGYLSFFCLVLLFIVIVSCWTFLRLILHLFYSKTTNARCGFLWTSKNLAQQHLSTAQQNFERRKTQISSFFVVFFFL